MKRFFDIFCSFLVLLIGMPLMLTLSFFIALNLGLPIVFKQARPGFNAKPFNMFKFRTMKQTYGNDGNLLPDDQRMTSFGKFLRSTSLDELPGLWNVLKGDMSLVGPRPLLMEYLPLYNVDQMRRHDVKPGITGWAQVNGRNAISWEDKFKLDVWYVDNQSLLLDLKILLLTVKKVLIRDGITGDGEVTMSKFTGTPEGIDNE